MKMRDNFFKSIIVLITSFGLLMLSSCRDDESAQPINPGGSRVIEEDPLVTVFNSFRLEDRTEGGIDASISISGNRNGTVQILRDAEDYFLDFSGFSNIEESIDRDSSIIASRFAVFLATSGTELGAQNSFDARDQPIYIGTLETNGASRMELKPASNNGGEVILGGVTINTNGDIELSGSGFIIEQRSRGSRNEWYDWVILHPFEGENLRPITYPGIVADLDADHRLEQNFNLIYNTSDLLDQTDEESSDINPSNINNGMASLVSYKNQSFIRLSNFMNINEVIDRDHPNVIASQFAVFLAVSGFDLDDQNSFDEGDRPVYIGILEENGFQDIPLISDPENDSGLVTLGDNNIVINTNENIRLDVNGFIVQQKSTGGRELTYDWIILHPFEGGDLRPISYPGIVANLNAAGEL